MLKFLKYTFAVITGTFVGLILFFVVLLFVGLIIVATIKTGDAANDIKENSVLVIKLDNPIQEKAPSNPLKDFSFFSFASDNTLGLNDILDNIERASLDPKIRCILLNVGYVQASYETVEEIRNALIAFKKSGKYIIAYSDYYMQSAYYLCSIADKVYMNPEGILEFRGISSQLIFLKNTFEKLGIKPQPLRHGKYKGAIEMFANEKISDENREQHQVFVDAVWGFVVKEISKSRNIPEAQLQKIADSLLVRNGEMAFKYGLIDSLKYYDQIIDQFRDSLKLSKKEKVSAVALSKYIDANSDNKQLAYESPSKIAVVIAQGDIVPGTGDETNIGSDTYSKLLRDLRNDTTVKAIVFRLNTGGGSSLASESIWREVNLAARDKPVIVSMGDYCASGGYYIACPATEVIANPLTLTGSIGVYGLLFDARGLMDKIGVSTDIVKTNKYSDIGTATRSLTPFEEAVIKKEIDLTYKKFVEHVALGRKLLPAFVDSIGQGRIWSGTDAKEIKLIDSFGGLTDAIASASKRAKLGKDFDVAYYPKDIDVFETMMKGFKTKMQSNKIEEYFGEYKMYFEAFKIMQQSNGVQMRVPFLMKME